MKTENKIETENGIEVVPSPSNKQKAIKAIKIIGFVLLIALFCYLAYGVGGSLYGWLQQPLFKSSAGHSSRSYGFLVVACVYGVFAIINIIGGALYYYFLFVRSKRKAKATV